jgi:predicted RNA binding protein YcfA (HicA-like mRNA interferase family)
MKSRDVMKRIQKLGGVHVRTTGSHYRYDAPIPGGGTAHTSVQLHAGDIPIGTLLAIQRDMEAAFGKGWLR